MILVNKNKLVFYLFPTKLDLARVKLHAFARFCINKILARSADSTTITMIVNKNKLVFYLFATELGFINTNYYNIRTWNGSVSMSHDLIHS